jgi:NAD(P)-dependent dehydrogenase (short-subunit alcohol dehydrogenase family)
MSARKIWTPALLAGLGAGLAAALVAQRRRRMDFRGKVVVITGGSRGLGLVLARRLGAEGARLFLLARDPQTLETARRDLAGRGYPVTAIPCDIGQRDQVEAAIRQVVAEAGRLDVLINTAGLVQVGPLEHMRVEDFEDAMRVHFWGPLYASLVAWPVMRRQGGGRIVNVSSIGGQVAVPHLAPYIASKHALEGLSDALRAEMARDGILVSTICPGLMRTGSPVNGAFKGQAAKEYAWFSILDALPLFSMDADRAARQIVQAARYGLPKRTLTLQARLLALFNTVFPNLMAVLTAWANRLLPAPIGPTGDQPRRGYESIPAGYPTWLTVLNDRAAVNNNESEQAVRQLGE